MGAKNKVIAGDYVGKGVGTSLGNAYIIISFKEMVKLDKFNLESYEVVTEETRKSAASGVARGAVGAALLGPIGVLAGLSAKNKGTYNVALKFKDGRNCLIEVNDKIYKAIITTMF